MKRICRFTPAIFSFVAIYSVGTTATAAIVTYTFSTTVSSVSPGATGFPASLVGVNPGDPVTGTISYDAATPVGVNPSSSTLFLAATYYALNSPTFSYTIDGVTFDTWDPTESVFIWDNYPTLPPSATNYDGLLFTNFTLLGNPQYILGNLILPTSTRGDTALPDDEVTGHYNLTLKSSGYANWLETGIFNLVKTSDPLSGDLNADGFVGIEDLNIVLGNWNQNVTQGELLLGDPSNDGFVGIEDLNVVLGNWNAGTPPADTVVPEPGATTFLLIGSIAFLRRKHQCI